MRFNFYNLTANRFHQGLGGRAHNRIILVIRSDINKWHKSKNLLENFAYALKIL